MQATIEPGSISGTITAPPSKSVTQRAFAAALLHKGSTVITNAGTSDDEHVALDVIQQLGAKIEERTADTIEIISNGVAPVTDTINCGESGLSARLFTPIAALSDKQVTITGMGTLLSRSMDTFREVLEALKVEVSGFNGYLPITVKGPLQGLPVQINTEGSSQFLSGLLLAYGSIAKGPVVIEAEGLKSKPYIDLTLEVMRHFGKPIPYHNYKKFDIDPSFFSPPARVEINVEGDWSSAAYLLVAGAIAGAVTVKNLNIDSVQADVAILKALGLAGAEPIISHDAVSVKSMRLKGFEFDATDCPDLFPVLAILAAYCDGESYINGVHRLFNKESNRAKSISEMLENFGALFSIEEDSLVVTGVRKLQGTVIDAYHDHRIVMAAAIGALRASGPVDILNAEAVNKSYPSFFEDLISCGVRCNLLR
jgi:3-phosphoshikimate 1-carboxyvinyltransferase